MTICDYVCSGPSLLKAAKKKFPNAKLFAYNPNGIGRRLKRILEKELGTNVNIIMEMKDDIKFCKIIMNPPYDKNLHLKILQEAMKHSDDIVNLSPIRWLQDPLAEYKKNSDWKKFSDIRKRIETLDVVPMKEASDLFGALFNVNLGIYHITPKGGWGGFDVTPLTKKIIDRVIESGGLHPVTYIGQANAVVIKKMTNPNRSTAYNLCSNAVGYKNKNSLEDKVQNCIVFNSPEEAENFRKMTETKMYRFCVKTLINNENFMSYYRFFFNAPTYTHPWTDEQLYKYFDLTPEEVNIIENEIK